MQGDKTEKKKYEPPVPTRVGKKRKKVKVRSFWENGKAFLQCPMCSISENIEKIIVSRTAMVPNFFHFAVRPFSLEQRVRYVCRTGLWIRIPLDSHYFRKLGPDPQ
jgi:hypothetical protein